MSSPKYYRLHNLSSTPHVLFIFEHVPLEHRSLRRAEPTSRGVIPCVHVSSSVQVEEARLKEEKIHHTNKRTLSSFKQSCRLW